MRYINRKTDGVELKALVSYVSSDHCLRLFMLAKDKQQRRKIHYL